jgi:hypothetical protein
MTHWIELAIFLFAYAFVGFFVFQGPVSIFFLFGLFSLGIQNTMSYHVDAILLTMLMFYMVCATLIISIYFPFTSKPERLYLSLRRRFFRHCAKWIRIIQPGVSPEHPIVSILRGDGSALLEKMSNRGVEIDSSSLTGGTQHQLTNLNYACELLHGQLQILALRRLEFSKNPLIRAARHQRRNTPLADLCDNLAMHGPPGVFDRIQSDLASVEEQLTELLGEDGMERYDPHEVAQFYVYLNLQASIYESINACRKAQSAVDWQKLGETRF